MLKKHFMAAMAACITVGSAALPAGAASVVAIAGGDVAFNEICAAGNAAGSGNQSCEFAVAELRGGNNGPSGDFEVGMQAPPTNPIRYSDQDNFVWGKGTEYAFSLLFNAGALSLTVGNDT